MTEQQSQQRTRVQFDFAPEALARFDALREQTDAKNRAEVLRNALRLYEWFLGEFGNEQEIIVRRGSDHKEVSIPVSLLFFNLHTT